MGKILFFCVKKQKICKTYNFSAKNLLYYVRKKLEIKKIAKGNQI